MAIWLVGRTVEDLVRKLVLIGDNKRISVRPNANNEVYEYSCGLIHYQLAPAAPALAKYGWDIGDQFGRITSPIHEFKDVNGEFQKFKYFGIDIWDAVPEEFRDVIFWHELVELESLTKGTIQPDAHKLAVRKTEKYVQKKLTLEEQDRFNKCIEDLKSK